MKGQDDVTSAPGADRSDCHLPALTRQEDPAGPVINLDSPLIGSIEGQIEMTSCDCFEEWAVWPVRRHYLPVSNLRNPPPSVLVVLPWDDLDGPAPFDLP